MSVATRRPSLTPSSPASRRGSWVDLPVISAPPSRRGSRVDLSISTSSASTSSSDAYAGPSSTKLAIDQLLSNLSHVSESQSRMSSPKSSRSTPASETPSGKRKYEADSEPTNLFKVASAAELQLPSDPIRRASIINLATAAAAAVLQSQASQRRMSTHPEQEQKRQRVEQLGLLIEQARKASVGSMSLDITRHVEGASQNAAIASALASHLGLTPQASAATTPSASTPVPASPTKASALTLAVPATPTTPKSPLATVSVTAAQVSDDAPAAQADAPSSEDAAKTEDEEVEAPQRPTSPSSPTGTPSITLNSAEEPQASLSSNLPSEHQPEWQSTVSSEGFLDQAKQLAHTYSRFYRFEKEWAQKALELERRRSSVRIDPLFNPNPTLSPLAADASEDKSRGLPASPKQHSAPESRAMSRGASPFGDFSAAGPSSRTAHSVPNSSFSSSSHRASSSGLANVLSNFAELIEHRQRSCSGLEALAKQAKELPVKRLSQPNPQFRTTFGEFSWNKKAPSNNSAAHRSSHQQQQTINEGDADSDDASSSFRGDESASVYGSEAPATPAAASSAAVVKSASATSRPSLLHVISDRKVRNDEGAGEGSDKEGPATPRSTMSIASML